MPAQRDEVMLDKLLIRLAEAIHLALDAGKGPAADATVQLLLDQVRALRERLGRDP